MSSNAPSYTFDNPYNGGAGILVPGILKWRARAALKKLQEDTLKNSEIDSGNIDFEKAEGLLNSFLSRDTKNERTGQRPAFAYCPKLSAKPFWNSEDAELLQTINKALSENLSVIRDEYNQGVSGDISASEINSGKKLLQEDSWKNINLGGMGLFTQQARDTFPKTVSVLSEFKESIFSAEFIIMEPDTQLPPHTDATNAYLVCHMGLEVGDNCGVQVHKEICDFHEGDIIFFDQSFVHSAWNKGSRTRVNLLITFFHPEITAEERAMIEEFVKRVKIQCLIFSPLLLIEYGFLKLLQKFRGQSA